MSEVTTLYRPVGQHELDRIRESGYRAFPPRRPEQPIFYPVTNEAYATAIARQWNAKYNTPPVGYVTRFQVETPFLSGYETHIVGSAVHEEYWIPAADRDAFNQHIVGPIEVIAAYRGPAAGP